MNISKNKSLKFLTLLFVSVISFVISITSFCSNKNVVLAQDNSEQVYEEEFVYDSVIVVLDSSISAVNKVHSKEFFNGVEIDYVKDLTYRNYNKTVNADFKQILQLFLVNKTREGVLYAIETLKNLEGVFSVEPNFCERVEATQEEINTEIQVVNNQGLWGLKSGKGINAVGAWNITTGSKDVRVGIIDTGIAQHVDLANNLDIGYDFVNYNTITSDDVESHGTHVAGIIGAVWNGLGVTGVCKDVTLVSLQVYTEDNDGDDKREVISIDGIIRAIDWAQDRWGTEEQIDIINYSISGFGENTTVRQEVSQYNGLFVWSAGNENEDVDVKIAKNGSFALSNLISVGALKSDYNIANPFRWENGTTSGSNYSSSGVNVDIYAPGATIASTMYNEKASEDIYKFCYGYNTGTSMAAPFVTGVAALMLSYNPTLTASELKSKILSSAQDITITLPSGSTQTAKKLDAYNAVLLSLYDITVLSNGTVEIDSFYNNGYTALEVPDTLCGRTVVTIDSLAFANQTQLTSVTLPATVTSIGESAFSGCTNLTSINLGVAQTIGDYAFQNCTSLTTISGLSGVVYIGELAFSNCSALTSINLGVTQTIGDYAFQNCTSLTTISGLSGVVYIGELAFSNCSALTSIIIPNTISNVGAGAFAGCNNLVITSYSSNFVAEGNILYNSNKTKIITTGKIVSNITIEDTITEICRYAFFNNTNLTDIEINNFIYIRGYAFANCSNLNTVTINSTIVPSLEPGAFNNTYFSLYVPTGCEEDYYEAFSGYASNVPIYEKEYEITMICSLTGQPVGVADAYYLCGVSLVYIPSKEHYEMEGLYDMPNGQGNKYLSITYNETTKKLQSEATANGWQQHSNGILYVNWTRISSAVSCNAVANNSIISKPTVQLTSGVASTITAPSISGYNFSSWSVAGVSYTTTSITINVTLHRSYNTGNITLAGSEHPTQDAYITIYYTEAPAEECVAEGTLITLADGRQVPVEQLTGNERLLVWNLKTGRFDSAPILFIDSEEAKVYDIINLYFSDGTHVKVISEHAFWDFDLNKYVYLREDASKYIGHYFNKQVTDKHGKMAWEKVQLTDVSITKEYTTAWSPVTEKHLCLYVNGMLSMPGGTEGLANTFEVNGRTMKIDRAKYRKDIKTYGVYTYEEFYELYPVPQEMFEAVDGQYLKVAIGKGLLTHEELTYLIERYSKFFE